MHSHPFTLRPAIDEMRFHPFSLSEARRAESKGAEASVGAVVREVAELLFLVDRPDVVAVGRVDVAEGNGEEGLFRRGRSDREIAAREGTAREIAHLARRVT